VKWNFLFWRNWNEICLSFPRRCAEFLKRRFIYYTRWDSILSLKEILSLKKRNKKDFLVYLASVSSDSFLPRPRRGGDLTHLSMEDGHWKVAARAEVAGPSHLSRRSPNSPTQPFSSQTKKLDVTSTVWPDVGRVFRILIKKLISELTWKPRDEFFEVFDRIISTCGVL